MQYIEERNRKKRLITLALILVLFIGVGYAVLGSTLNINGTARVSQESFDIHFQNVVVTSGSVTPSSGNEASISPSDNKLVTFSVPLSMPGDYYEFTVDVVNNGTLDAMVDTVVSKLNDNLITDSTFSNTGNLSFLSYNVSYSDGVEIEPKHLLKAGESETYKVRIEYKRDITEDDLAKVPNDGFSASFTFKVDYQQADDTAKDRAQ